MDLKIFATIFLSVFIAELGDKTQLATMLFATDKKYSNWMIFAAASGALVLSSAIGVFIGSKLGNWLSPTVLKNISGVAFILIGIYSLFAKK